MSRIGRRLQPLLLALVLVLGFLGGTAAKTLPLPERLVGLNSPAGEAMLMESQARQSYWDLSIQFLTQKTQSFCGVASIVMILNAIGVPAPTTADYKPYEVFTQDNLFTPETEAVVSAATIEEQGMTLDQIGGVLDARGVKAEVHHAADTTLDAFRAKAKDYLGSPGRYVIINYLRKAIDQERGGHISPLAAYDQASDRFLILDVARYKYPPVWVTAADLYGAMNTTDSDNDNKTRGFVLIDGAR